MPHSLYHAIHVSHALKTEYSQVFISRTIRALGASIISIFVPIFIFQSVGSDINRALPLIAGYHALLYGLRALMTPLALNLVSRIGGKHVLVISAVVDAVAYIFLAFLDYSVWLLIPIAVLLAASSISFFCALHMELSYSMGARKAKDVSNVEIARKITMALGPLVGGLIAGSGGILYAALLASCLFFVSMIPLHLRDEPLKNAERVDMSRLKQYVQTAPVRSNFGMGLNSVAAMLIWPFFIFIVLESFEKVGIIVSVSLLLAILVMHISGAHDQPAAAEKQVRYGSHGSALTHILRTFAVNPLTIGFVNLLNDIAIAFLIVPYISQYYRNASHGHRSSYVAAMEVMFSMGAASMWLVTSVFFYAFSDIKIAMFLSFAAAAIGVMYSRNIIKPLKIDMPS